MASGAVWQIFCAPTQKPLQFSGGEATPPVEFGLRVRVARLSDRPAHRCGSNPGPRQQIPPDPVQVVAQHAQARVPQMASSVKTENPCGRFSSIQVPSLGALLA